MKMELDVNESLVKAFGKNELRELMQNIIDRYGNMEYFDEDLIKEVVEKKY